MTITLRQEMINLGRLMIFRRSRQPTFHHFISLMKGACHKNFIIIHSLEIF